MKKKKLANVFMVVIVVCMLGAGVLTALYLRGQQDNALGSEFQVPSIGDDAVLISENPENLCTVMILCDTILGHQDDLDPAKAPYVPADGVILPETMVEFNPGETAFEVLQRVCTARDIQLEYSWTPIYDSYYIEGINHLYEFDCGSQSGWMYEVNDEFPNYGCSGYEVKSGDTIVWCYTCEGLGSDVGAKME